MNFTRYKGLDLQKITNLNQLSIHNKRDRSLQIQIIPNLKVPQDHQYDILKKTVIGKYIV